MIKLKPHFKIWKKMFSKKKNELNKANKSQINQIFIRRIKSYLKKDSLLASFISCVKLLNAPFSSRLRNNSRTHFFLFLFFFFFILDKTTSCKNKMSSSSHRTKNQVFHYRFHFLCSARVRHTWYQKSFNIKIWYIIMWT